MAAAAQNDEQQLEIVVLGVGKGASAVYEGNCSSSIVIRDKKSKHILLLVDIGLGVFRQLLKHTVPCEQQNQQNLQQNQQNLQQQEQLQQEQEQNLHSGLPSPVVSSPVVSPSPIVPSPSQQKNHYNVFVTHNHSDHSGELPVVISVEAMKGNTIRIFSQRLVSKRLRELRCAELFSCTALAQLEKHTEWICCDESVRVPLDTPCKWHKLPRLWIQVLRAQHSELCYGFLLFRTDNQDDQPILAFSGDSGCDHLFFDQLWRAKMLFLDGRKVGTWEHAGFSEIEDFYQRKQLLDRTVYVYHYGNPESEKPLFKNKNISAVVPGQIIDL